MIGAHFFVAAAAAGAGTAVAPAVGMNRDAVALALLVLAFATLVTVHVALAAGLAARAPRWRGPVALLVPPLAPFWGWRTRLRARTVLWLVAAAVYGALLVFALRG